MSRINKADWEGELAESAAVLESQNRPALRWRMSSLKDVTLLRVLCLLPAGETRQNSAGKNVILLILVED